MTDYLSGDDWTKLTPAERIAVCRANANEAVRSALAAHIDIKETYLKIAAKWNELADEIEARAANSN